MLYNRLKVYEVMSGIRVGDTFTLKYRFHADKFTISKIYMKKGKSMCWVSWVDSYGELGTDYRVDDVEMNFNNGDWKCERYIRRKKLEKINKNGK